MTNKGEHMKHYKSKEMLYRLSKELQELRMLHKIQQDALLNCYNENLDYGHIFAVDTIYDEKLKNIIKNL